MGEDEIPDIDLQKTIQDAQQEIIEKRDENIKKNMMYAIREEKTFDQILKEAKIS